jgi:hypothetical protein
MKAAADVERVASAPASTEPGEIGDQGVKLAGKALGRRHEVPAGEAEAVQVHHHRRIG